MIFEVKVTGLNPKEHVVCVMCMKGEITFDFEMYQLSWPSDFKKFCLQSGAIWAIGHEHEIREAIRSYTGK